MCSKKMSIGVLMHNEKIFLLLLLCYVFLLKIINITIGNENPIIPYRINLLYISYIYFI